MEEYINKDGKRLRLGYTTGTCAAAASRAAARALLTGVCPEKITIKTPKGISVELRIIEIRRDENSVTCAVKKDSGDDPDITNGIYIHAKVMYRDAPGIEIDGGEGIGRVTKRGLDRPVGDAAINTAPRRQITDNLTEACRALDYGGGLSVVITAPEGGRIAKKTFNPRLGIEGGISILGTSGIVEPMSEAALIETIRLELSQRRGNGRKYILFIPGNYGLEYIKGMGFDANDAVVTSNFIGASVDMASDAGFSGVLIVGHIGKLVKLAGGMFDTHSKYGDCRMEIIAAHAAAAGLSRTGISKILNSATCDAALDILKENEICEETLSRIISRIEFHLNARAAGRIEAGALLFSRRHGFLSETRNARALLEKITKE
ncbi:MAG: cobalamin biosynthesis protein CbiD [Clostridia bacterium]|nr:cobalamin biosynthesis protein CbiD [Clostridia bacterium]